MIKIPHNILVSEIMTRNVATIDSDATIQQASILLRKRNIHGLIVISGKDVSGIVTDKDIVSKVVAENASARDVKVKDIMSAKVIAAKPGDSIADATRVMFANDVSRLPVIDSKGSLAGVISVRDMMRVYPGITEILDEELQIKEPNPLPDRTTIEGRCEECDNIAEDLVEVDGRWLCPDCSQN